MLTTGTSFTSKYLHDIGTVVICGLDVFFIFLYFCWTHNEIRTQKKAGVSGTHYMHFFFVDNSIVTTIGEGAFEPWFPL